MFRLANARVYKDDFKKKEFLYPKMGGPFTFVKIVSHIQGIIFLGFLHIF
jgi:hypothetical protein